MRQRPGAAGWRPAPPQRRQCSDNVSTVGYALAAGVFTIVLVTSAALLC